MEGWLMMKSKPNGYAWERNRNEIRRDGRNPKRRQIEDLARSECHEFISGSDFTQLNSKPNPKSKSKSMPNRNPNSKTTGDLAEGWWRGEGGVKEG